MSPAIDALCRLSSIEPNCLGIWFSQVMSPANRDLTMSKKKARVRRNAAGGRPPDLRPSPSRSKTKPPDNRSFTMAPVFMGHPDLTTASSTSVVSAGSFTADASNELTHGTAKQAIYDIFYNTLLQILVMNEDIEDALRAIVDEHYHPSTANTDAFRFRPSKGNAQPLTFSAACRHLHRSDDENPLLCALIPAGITKSIWDLTHAMFLDRPKDDVVGKAKPFLSPTIRLACDRCTSLRDSPHGKKLKSVAPMFVDTIYHNYNGELVSNIFQQEPMIVYMSVHGESAGTDPPQPSDSNDPPNSVPLDEKEAERSRAEETIAETSDIVAPLQNRDPTNMRRINVLPSLGLDQTQRPVSDSAQQDSNPTTAKSSDGPDLHLLFEPVAGARSESAPGTGSKRR